MKNILLREPTARDIAERIDRVLRGLGNPEPPLVLLQVRELLKLDRVFFSGSNDGLLAESISRLKVAGKQVLLRPTLLFEAIRKLDLKALYVPDKKRILLDQALPELKHRWNEAHEIGHSLLPWHEEMMLGDTTHTLTPSCHDQIEAEANYAAGQLLFLGDRFVAMANDTPPTLDAIKALKRIFGNTITTTLWRYIESTHPGLPMVGAVSVHPHKSRRPAEFDPTAPCRYYVRSGAFAERFHAITDIMMFRHIESYCGAQRGGTLGASEIVLTDANGDGHLFKFETFFNQYEALTLAVYDRPRVNIV